MNTTNTILLEEEPSVFDVQLVGLNSRWLDWNMAKNNDTPEASIAKANTEVAKMINDISELVLLECDLPRYNSSAKQLTALVELMHQYQRGFDMFQAIQEDGWFQHIKPSDPSVFATSGSPEPIQRWLYTVVKEHKLSYRHLTTLATFIINSIRTITRSQYEAKWGKKAPAVITSSVPGIPNLLWVLHYALNKGCDLETAHIAGVTALEDKKLGKLDA